MRIVLFCENRYAIDILQPLYDEALRQQRHEVLWYVHAPKIQHFPLAEKVRWTDSMQTVYDFQPEAIYVPGNIVPYYLHKENLNTDSIYIIEEAGQTIRLDASKSVDPDGDGLTFLWWLQPEIGKGRLQIATPTMPLTTVTIPKESQGQTFHLICEVHDNSPHHLVAYRRVIIRVNLKNIFLTNN